METLITLIYLAAISSVFASQCNHRDYGKGASVCVCSEHLGCDDLNLKVSHDNGVVTSYATSKAGARFLHREYRFLKEVQNGQHFDVTVEVNRGKKYQKIIGFGGAFTDAAGINIAKLPKSLQTRLIKDYFGSDGLEYRLGRIPIGGSDFSTRAYSHDDNPDDETLSKFALQHEDFDYKLPYLRMASEVSNHSLKYFGSPWSAPAWMKTNKQLNHRGNLIGQPGGKYYKLFAKYFVKFLQEYAKNNVTLWGLTMENEPYNPNNEFNGMGLNASLERDFLKLDLGPELKSTDFGDLKVMIFDDNIPPIIDYATTVLSDKDAAKYAAGIAFHWYESFHSNSNRSVLDVIAKRFPEHFLLSTEACDIWNGAQHAVSLGNWATFDRYAEDIIKVLNHYSSGWVDWNLALNPEGGPNWVNNFVDAPIIVNATSNEYYKQPFFYALGHFSKFLVPDSIRLEDDGKIKEEDKEAILVTIFERPDRSTVVTVLNKNNHSILLQLHDPLNGFVVVEVMASSLESLIWY